MTKRKRTTAKPTVVGELVDRLTALDRRMAKTEDAARSKLLNDEWAFTVRSILKAEPENLADCAAVLMLATCRADMLRIAVEDYVLRSPDGDDDAAADAKRLVGALARVLRHVASAAKVDLAAIGGADFLFEMDEFPEFDDSNTAKAA